MSACGSFGLAGPFLRKYLRTIQTRLLHLVLSMHTVLYSQEYLRSPSQRLGPDTVRNVDTSSPSILERHVSLQVLRKRQWTACRQGYRSITRCPPTSIVCSLWLMITRPKLCLFLSAVPAMSERIASRSSLIELRLISSGVLCITLRIIYRKFVFQGERGATIHALVPLLLVATATHFLEGTETYF